MSSSNDLKGWNKLPSELRLEILEFALTPPIELPTPTISQKHRIMRYRYSYEQSGLWEAPTENPTANLLLVKRQFYKDVKYILDLLPNVYHVDVMLVKDRGLWPTWHCPKPPSSDVIEEVTVTFRIFEPTDDLDFRFKDSLRFYGGVSGPVPAVWVFHRLFLTLVHEGPGLMPRYPMDVLSNRLRFIIKRIKMNILSPNDGVAHTRLCCREDEGPQGWGFFPCLCRSSERPEDQLAKFIGSHMSYISEPSKDGIENIGRYFKYLLEGISLRVNGVEYTTLDLDRSLEDIDFGGRDGPTLRRWCSAIRKKRETMK
ncbi:uncharacterized protein B0J16DRAFT_418178 [Fusarium flagelliforme]|uniref:Uncharacterized protein n=1 Tax=Fusarium flagelliforme TaxID=2675880 RepID=A0A395M805_9HYPO|nr:uncharacterized protein B0J16DRAFT_418178 [Fusarium flagelliforme]KAH7174730.1 hypothetical protein B0J16DRAFT_418178 [Fusarium flagelliforme]RFN44037.1 hypothetical protein FIE12Z_11742 [Fusarium flagelliforme]